MSRDGEREIGRDEERDREREQKERGREREKMREREIEREGEGGEESFASNQGRKSCQSSSDGAFYKDNSSE